MEEGKIELSSRKIEQLKKQPIIADVPSDSNGNNVDITF